MTIKEAAWYLTRKLTHKGFTIHYSEATTNSTYLKIEFKGRKIGTIRISDHPQNRQTYKFDLVNPTLNDLKSTLTLIKFIKQRRF